MYFTFSEVTVTPQTGTCLLADRKHHAVASLLAFSSWEHGTICVSLWWHLGWWHSTGYLKEVPTFPFVMRHWFLNCHERISVLTTPMVNAPPHSLGSPDSYNGYFFSSRFSRSTHCTLQSWLPGKHLPVSRARSLSWLSFSVEPASPEPSFSWSMGPVFLGVHFVVFLSFYTCACYWCFTLCFFCPLCAKDSQVQVYTWIFLLGTCLWYVSPCIFTT